MQTAHFLQVAHKGNNTQPWLSTCTCMSFSGHLCVVFACTTEQPNLLRLGCLLMHSLAVQNLGPHHATFILMG